MPTGIILGRPAERTPGFYVPVAMSPSILTREHRQPAAYFLNLLHWRWLCWQADAKGWVRLKQEYIVRVIPAEIWPAIRDRLVGRGVIEHNTTWVPKIRSQGYRLAPEYRAAKRIECTDEALARRIREVYADERGANLPVHRWLAENLERLDFDLGRAEKIIDTLEPDPDSPIPIDEYRDLLRGIALRLANRDHRLTCDPYGRVHTLVTRLAKELRRCLSVDGQPLVGLDLANSQPLIAGLVARQFYGSEMAAARLRARTFKLKARDPYHQRTPQRYEPDPSHTDLAEYMRVCQAGRLYESLMRPGEDRERFKRQFLTMMYAANNR